MRFLGDMGVSRRVIEWLRANGHDAVHLRDEGLQRLPNGDIFQEGFAEQRIVLTFDLDFGEILAGSAGQVVSVILFRLHDTRTDHVIERLHTVLEVELRTAGRSHCRRRGRPSPRPQIAHRKLLLRKSRAVVAPASTDADRRRFPSSARCDLRRSRESSFSSGRLALPRSLGRSFPPSAEW